MGSTGSTSSTSSTPSLTSSPTPLPTAAPLTPYYGFAHRVNDPDMIIDVLNSGGNAIEIDICAGWTMRPWGNEYFWWVSHNDLGICNNFSAVKLQDWLTELQAQLNNGYSDQLAMLWLDVKTPSDAAFADVPDIIQNSGILSHTKVLYDLTAFNDDSKSGFDMIQSKLTANEGVSFCAGKSCDGTLDTVKDIYDYYVDKGFTRGTFNSGDSINIDEEFLTKANSAEFNGATDPYRFKMVLTWTNGLEASMKDYIDQSHAYSTDGQIIGGWHEEWDSNDDDTYLDNFDDAIAAYSTVRKATASDNPFV